MRELQVIKTSLPAYDRSWNLPAIYWIPNFSPNRSAASSQSAKRSFAIRSMIFLPLSLVSPCLVLIRGWKVIQHARAQPVKAMYLGSGVRMHYE